jgi:hypothetical protein|nr:MAG TPA: hypothetical protein [Caudoviricetes sp.]
MGEYLALSPPPSKIEMIRRSFERSRELRRQQQIDSNLMKLILILGGYVPNTLTPIEEDVI